MTKDGKQKDNDERKRKNVESASRSRDRLKNETNWMAIQMSENEDRMNKLEREIDSLQKELNTTSKKKPSKNSSTQKDRPAWFGKPF